MYSIKIIIIIYTQIKWKKILEDKYIYNICLQYIIWRILVNPGADEGIKLYEPDIKIYVKLHKTVDVSD